MHPNTTVQDALAFFDMITAVDRPLGEPGAGYKVWKRTGHPFSESWKKVRTCDPRYRPEMDEDAQRQEQDDGDFAAEDEGDDDED